LERLGAFALGAATVRINNAGKFGVAKSMNRRSTPIGLAKVDLSRQLGDIGKEAHPRLRVPTALTGLRDQE
jgi:hypothetical protein